MLCGGSGLKPFTPMGAAMLGTGAVLMPGGVLVPAGCGGVSALETTPVRMVRGMGGKQRGGT